ncbi:hypothetical protein Q7P37_008297 [Cladosporium fusiforme]
MASDGSPTPPPCVTFDPGDNPPLLENPTDSMEPYTDLPPCATFTPGNNVTLVVGREEEHLAVNIALLKSSHFVTVALKKHWKEGQTGIIILPDEDPCEMTHYLCWVSFRSLPTDFYKANGPVPFQGDAPGNAYTLLVKLYVLGERQQDVGFRQALLDEIIRLTNIVDDDSQAYFPSTSHINALYEGNLEDSPARHLFVDLYVRLGEVQWVEDEKYKTVKIHENVEFMFDISRTMFQMLSDYPDSSEWRGINVDTEDYIVS